jgi:hypothetical protein
VHVELARRQRGLDRGAAVVVAVHLGSGRTADSEETGADHLRESGAQWVHSGATRECGRSPARGRTAACDIAALRLIRAGAATSCSTPSA